MENYLTNKLVTLIKEDDHYLIIHKNLTVGNIKINNEYLDINIYPNYQSKHYATNALYLLTSYAHDILNIQEIKAIIPINNDIAKHVVEHCGYHIEQKNCDHTLYIHTKASTTIDAMLQLPKDTNVIYLAGGCFWGMERVFKVLDGIIQTRTGYANGNMLNPSYEDIIRNETGYKECVRVIYDTNKIDIKTILKAYFMCIDPTVKNQQKEDIGTQYQTGIYYKDPTLLKDIQEIYNNEKSKYDQFYVELQPLHNFYEAEEYHQNYLEKNPDGYCHITLVDINKVKELNKSL